MWPTRVHLRNALTSFAYKVTELADASIRCRLLLVNSAAAPYRKKQQVFCPACIISLPCQVQCLVNWMNSYHPELQKIACRNCVELKNFAVKKSEGNDVNSLFVSVSIVSYALYEGECTWGVVVVLSLGLWNLVVNFSLFLSLKDTIFDVNQLFSNLNTPNLIHKNIHGTKLSKLG